MDGKGHPLPASDEARHEKIPEHVERDKGRGDDPRQIIQPGPEAVDPEGRTYPYDGDSGEPSGEALVKDQRAHQDRGHSVAEAQADRR